MYFCAFFCKLKFQYRGMHKYISMSNHPWRRRFSHIFSSILRKSTSIQWRQVGVRIPPPHEKSPSGLVATRIVATLINILIDKAQLYYGGSDGGGVISLNYSIIITNVFIN